MVVSVRAITLACVHTPRCYLDVLAFLPLDLIFGADADSVGSRLLLANRLVKVQTAVI